MPDTWQTIEQAAVTLGLSVRTVNRHITGGKLQSRLFEGRREVLVSLPDPRPQTVPANPSPEAGSPDGSGYSSTQAAAAAADGKPQYDSVRRAVDTDYQEKPLDMQTMLTLADSVDDKASLAVAAYQTLARSAETQVQSLRRVAFGAWASVGVLATGAIVAVGWGTYRLTSAEGSAAGLQTQVAKYEKTIEKLETDKDQVREKLETEKVRLRDELTGLQIESARLKDRLARMAEEQASVIAASKMSGQPPSPATAPTTQPLTVGLTTRPAESMAVASPATTQPATRSVGGARPVFSTNPKDTFDPR